MTKKWSVLAENNNIRCEERNIAEHELVTADEVWLTSSTREIAPVIQLNNSPVGNGKAGEYWRIMIDHYQSYKQKLREGKA